MAVIFKEPKTREAIEAEADAIAKIKVQIRKLTVARDAATLKINEQYNPQIKELEAERDARELALAPFVSARRRSLWGAIRAHLRRFQCMASAQGRQLSATRAANPTML